MTIRLLLALLLLALLLPTFLIGCNATETTGEESNVMPKPTIPPIDATEPVEMETATFALG